MQRVRVVGRDLPVAPRHRQGPLGQRREVVCVDGVVMRTGMIRNALEDPFRDRAGFPLDAERLVGTRCRGHERQGPEQRGLGVVGIVGSHLCPRVGVPREPRGLGAGIGVGVIRLEGGDVRRFAGRSLASGTRLLQHRATRFELGSGRNVGPQGVHVGHGHAPGGERAVRILFRGRTEGGLRLRIGHVVEQGQTQPHPAAGCLTA